MYVEKHIYKTVNLRYNIQKMLFLRRKVVYKLGG